MPRIEEAHEELLRVLEAAKPSQYGTFDNMQSSYLEDSHRFMDEPVQADPKTLKEQFLELLIELPDEHNKEFLLDELKHLSLGLQEGIKFKDVSAVVDQLFARDCLKSGFHDFLELFVDKMEPSERDKLLILILSHIGVTESFSEYSGLKQLFEKTRAKTKCVRYSLNLVSKHYEDNSYEKLACFVENLYRLLFAEKPPVLHPIVDLVEMVELFVKGLDFPKTRLTSEDALRRLADELSPGEFNREIERMLLNKQSEYYRLQEWLEYYRAKPKHSTQDRYFDDLPQDDVKLDDDYDHADFEKKLEELKMRARQVTADLRPDDEEELPTVGLDKERERPSARDSAVSNPDAESLIRLRNNFFADAESLMRESSNPAEQGSYRRLPSIRHTSEVRPKPEMRFSHDSRPVDTSEMRSVRQTKADILPPIGDHRIAGMELERERWLTEKEQLLARIDNLTKDLGAARKELEEKTFTSASEPKEVLEREIMYYKSAVSATDRTVAVKRLLRAMVERDADTDLVVRQLEDCAKTGKGQFMADLRDGLQSFTSAKGIKRSMFEGLLRFAIRSHTKDQSAPEAVNGVINSLVVTQQIEVTIDSLISILSSELPPFESKFSQGKLVSFQGT